MTTQVIIKSPKPNHLDVKVEKVYPNGEYGETHILKEGEEISLYIHSGVELKITEVAK